MVLVIVVLSLELLKLEPQMANFFNRIKNYYQKVFLEECQYITKEKSKANISIMTYKFHLLNLLKFSVLILLILQPPMMGLLSGWLEIQAIFWIMFNFFCLGNILVAIIYRFYWF